MRRYCAILLLFPLAALFLEWIKAPALCPQSHPAAICSQMAMMGHEPHACCKDKERQKKKDGQKNNKDGQTSTICFDCPLCYLVTFRSAIRFDVIRPETKAEFTVVPDNYLFTYYSTHWKPPDHSSLLRA